MKDPVQQAADYIQSETYKLGIPINYASCYSIALHLHQLWSGKKTPVHLVNIAQEHRQRYEGDSWDNGND